MDYPRRVTRGRCRFVHVCRTVGITCEAHIDDARGVVEHLQLQRFVWCMPSFGGASRVGGVEMVQECGLRQAHA